LHTAGSTYRKPGALMLIAANGDYAGLLSGGCLEADLQLYARAVIDSGKPRIVSYDLRSADDLLWGLGLGCEGAMDILLLRVGPAEGWEPLEHLSRCLAEHRPTSVGIVVESERPGLPVGAIALPPFASDHGALSSAVLDEAARSGQAGWFEAPAPRWKLFALPLSLPPRLLLLGAGPDAAPVVDFASRLSWKVTVIDHRPAYADASHFPLAEEVLLARPEQLLATIHPDHFCAAVVMSHHLPSDLGYLRALARTQIPYIGLLGPAVRREKLLADLAEDAEQVRARLRAPVGLPLGGRTPESIALAIVAEIHAFVHDTQHGAQPVVGRAEPDLKRA
jgi:xanthine/CO dehydrogenase XdhC/CoxF family maturation factor